MGIFLLIFLAGPRKDEEMVCMPFSQYGMYFLVYRFLFGTRNYLIP
jgi:hypothetical protein